MTSSRMPCLNPALCGVQEHYTTTVPLCMSTIGEETERMQRLGSTPVTLSSRTRSMEKALWPTDSQGNAMLRIDPAGCECTECTTGQSYAVDSMNDAALEHLINGGSVSNNSASPLSLTYEGLERGGDPRVTIENADVDEEYDLDRDMLQSDLVESVDSGITEADPDSWID